MNKQSAGKKYVADYHNLALLSRDESHALAFKNIGIGMVDNIRIKHFKHSLPYFLICGMGAILSTHLLAYHSAHINLDTHLMQLS